MRKNTALRRFTDHNPPDPLLAQRLPWSHPAMRNQTTRYPATVRDPVPGEPVLKSGHDNVKLGGVVQKGRLAGAPIYGLTIEERATCPEDCEMSAVCYGNRMHFARRWRAGEALEAALDWDLAVVARQHPEGFLIRLHVLGDFYSLDYVEKWSAWLDSHSALNVFGFTHRSPFDPIGRRLKEMRDALWPRFAMRFSGMAGPRNAVMTDAIPVVPTVGAAVVCAEQWHALQGRGEERCCATCAFCWTADAAVAFVEH